MTLLSRNGPLIGVSRTNVVQTLRASSQLWSPRRATILPLAAFATTGGFGAVARAEAHSPRQRVDADLDGGTNVARITVEDCLQHVNNRFALVILAAERARQLARGATPQVISSNKWAVTALREIAAGGVSFRENVEETVRTFLDERKRLDGEKGRKTRTPAANRRPAASLGA